MGETLEYYDSMRCDTCYGCDEPELCSGGGFTDYDSMADDFIVQCEKEDRIVRQEWLEKLLSEPVKESLIVQYGPIPYCNYSKNHLDMTRARCEFMPCRDPHAKLVIEHCHQHGWIRGITCISHNRLMRMYDEGEKFKDGILKEQTKAFAAHCPECGQWDDPWEQWVDRYQREFRKPYGPWFEYCHDKPGRELSEIRWPVLVGKDPVNRAEIMEYKKMIRIGVRLITSEKFKSRIPAEQKTVIDKLNKYISVAQSYDDTELATQALEALQSLSLTGVS